MRYFIGIVLLLLLQGCTTVHYPDVILTSNCETWYIPKGTPFQAKKTPLDQLKTYTINDDLMVLYMGKYLELEKQANACIK